MGLDISHLKPLPKGKMTEAPEFLTEEELRATPDFLLRNMNRLVEMEDENGQRLRGIYFQEVGYMRKGISKRFYNRFPVDLVSDDHRVFKEIFSLLAGDHIADLETRQKAFQQDFLDNYESGTSLIMLSR